jgi:hypothetical protein
MACAGLTLPSVRLSCTAANKPSKVAAVAQRGGLLFTHKVLAAAQNFLKLCCCVVH